MGRVARWVAFHRDHGAGGRGAAGGVKLCRTEHEVADFASGLLGRRLVTKQTGEQGKVVSRVYVEDGCDIKRELYLGLLVDRVFITAEESNLERCFGDAWAQYRARVRRWL